MFNYRYFCTLVIYLGICNSLLLCRFHAAQSKSVNIKPDSWSQIINNSEFHNRSPNTRPSFTDEQITEYKDPTTGIPNDQTGSKATEEEGPNVENLVLDILLRRLGEPSVLGDSPTSHSLLEVGDGFDNGAIDFNLSNRRTIARLPSVSHHVSTKPLLPNAGEKGLSSSSSLFEDNSGYASRKSSQTNSQLVYEQPHEKNSHARKGGEINSVKNVVKGDSGSVYVVTDEFNQNHEVTMDEIVNAVSQMSRRDIIDILSEPKDSKLQTTSSSGKLNDKTDTSQHFSISDTVSYNRKGSRDSDVILVKSKEGDTRLITVRDYKKFASQENAKKDEQELRSSTDKLTDAVNSDLISTLTSLEKLLRENSLPGNSEVKTEKREIIQRPSETSTSQHSELNDEEQKLYDIMLRILLENGNGNGNDATVKQDTAVKHDAPHYEENAYADFPRGKPSEMSVLQFLPYQNKLSVITTPSSNEREEQRKGIGNFFSKILSSKKNDRPKETRVEGNDSEQYLKLIMPQPNSSEMRQVTIPLPKPIHHRRKPYYPRPPPERSTEQSERKKAEKEEIPFVDRLFGKLSKQDVSPIERSTTSTLNLSSAHAALLDADIPESVRQKVLQQINDKPKFTIKTDVDVPREFYSPDSIDRKFKKFKRYKNKGKEKHIKFPDGYIYEIPIGYEEVGPQSHYVKQKPHSHKKKHKLEEEEEIPLLDIAVLADFNLLNDSEEQNSRSLPKIGDAKDFVDIRRYDH